MHELDAMAVEMERATALRERELSERDGAIQLVERMVGVLNSGGLGGLDGLHSEAFVDHDPLPGLPAGVEGVRAGVERLAQMGKDVRFHVEDCFATGDRVAYRIFGSWTVEPELAFEASLRAPRTYQLSGVGIYRCAGGQLVERWGPWVIHGPGDVHNTPDGAS
jgi:hypothetical protein